MASGRNVLEIEESNSEGRPHQVSLYVHEVR
jgi:hypothetical protein